MADDHLIPNTTQVPNSILDLLMPFLHDAETRILLYLCRRTYGFERHSDSVSLAQFTDGIRCESRQLDFGAGVSRRAAISALNILKDIGIVEQLEGGQGRSRIPVYRVNRKCEMVQWLHLISEDPENAREKIVHRLHLIREKHAPHAPISTKPKNDKELEDKMQEKHLLEKVQITTEKGANEFLENRDCSGLDAHTKPSITKPSKDNDGSLAAEPHEPTAKKRSRKIPDSQQPGTLHEHTVQAILGMVVEEFHCLANPTKLNEKFWDAQIKLIQRAQVIDFEGCLNAVDAYYSANPEKCPINEKSARARMLFSIGYAINEAKRNTPGRRRYGL